METAVFLIFWLVLLAIIATPLIILAAPFIAIALGVGFIVLLFMGFILLLWAISENIALSILIVSAIILVNLIVHSEKVKAFREKRL